MAILTGIFLVSLTKQKKGAQETSIQPTAGMVFDHPDPINDVPSEIGVAKEVTPKKVKKAVKKVTPKKVAQPALEVAGIPIGKMLNRAKKYALPFGFNPAEIDEAFAEKLINSFHWDCTTPTPAQTLEHFRKSKSFDFISTAIANNQQVFMSAIPVDSNSSCGLIQAQELTKEFVSVDPLLFMLAVKKKRMFPGFLGKAALTSVNAVTSPQNTATKYALVYKKRLFRRKPRIKAFDQKVAYISGIYGVETVKELVLVKA